VVDSLTARIRYQAAAEHGNSSNQYGNRDKKGLNSQIWRYYRVNLNIVF